ncbi:N-acetyltransferase [Longispora fulva]|uniref:Putative GNAT family acetyltransferase n=1 Tax=Longispora fulva TaxID=619741 RepID=A0A8J7KLB1_9ACTN|nr:GNAT family N-acetyltransferase [Longispora fulva]MBG6139129.1 putative GNAT family acetyltransferase [Longispora fulva]GIG58621.1 N-acetyltransferase [Longispora fulva]
MIIRRATMADTAHLRALRIEALADAPLAFATKLDEALSRPNETWVEATARGAAGVEQVQFVAEVDGRIVGSSIGLARDDHTYVIGVYIQPAHRGRGLLGGIIGALAHWSVACGRPELRLDVTSAAAQRAYQKMGFVETGRGPGFTPLSTWSKVFMALPLPCAAVADGPGGHAR